MSVISEVAQYLHNNSIGVLSTNLFYSSLPDAADACVGVFDTGGPEPDIYLPTKKPTFQVFIRSVDYDTGKAKLDAIRALLHNKYNSQLVNGGIYFYSINAMSEGGHIGKNARGLDEFSINFLCKTR